MQLALERLPERREQNAKRRARATAVACWQRSNCARRYQSQTVAFCRTRCTELERQEMRFAAQEDVVSETLCAKALCMYVARGMLHRGADVGEWNTRQAM